MGVSFRHITPLIWVLGSGLSGPAAGGTADSAEQTSKDPYTLSLPSPEQYKLGKFQTDGVSAPIRPTAAPVSLNGLRFQREIASAANEFKVDPALVHAVIQVESGYDVSALSPKGAQGLMQLLPDTARRFGVATAELLWRPDRNIRAGVAYLHSLLEQFGHDLALVLAAYNAGENAVLRYGRQVPPFPETREYVPKVLAIYHRLRPPTEPEPTVSPAKRVRIQYPPPLPEAQPDARPSD
jgi:soluble lytic murein transglycosylase-like protein